MHTTTIVGTKIIGKLIPLKGGKVAAWFKELIEREKINENKKIPVALQAMTILIEFLHCRPELPKIVRTIYCR